MARADLVRAFVRSDAEILDEIRDDLIVGTLWIPPERVTVAVSKGEVELGGRVDTRFDAEVLERFVRRVPGVVSVTSTVTWEREEPSVPRSVPRVPPAGRARTR